MLPPWRPRSRSKPRKRKAGRTIVADSAPAGQCVCSNYSEPPCEQQWRLQGWACPFLWRPRDLNISEGSRIRISLSTARFWTGKLGDPRSEVFRINVGNTGIVYSVLEAHRTKDYTQARVEDDVTRLHVWVNVWHRYNLDGRGRGVPWAFIV